MNGLSAATETLRSRRLSRLQGFGASIAVVMLAWAIYRLAPYNQKQLGSLYGSEAFSFTGAEFLTTAVAIYMVLLGAYHLINRDLGTSKSARFFAVFLRFSRAPVTLCKQGLAHEDRVAVLTTLLKVYYGPMMVMSLMVFCMNAIANGSAIAGSDAPVGFSALFNRHGFWFLMQLILLIDVLVFTIGYLVELPRLNNQIRSVDPTLLGWAAALACYPPFNELTGAVLGSQRGDFPQFDDPTLHLILNFLLLVLMAMYASASVALGFKASNLTHRGIVARGPYALIRHPSYVCKNVAWWIGSAPLVSEAFSRSLFDGIQSVASVTSWTLLYILRALTEEDHLRSVDSEYAVYAAKVRYRFVPGLI